ncbi:MAG: nitrilase-related carbon-nitrogen hydrolase [Pseudomonadota bacterium]
MGLSRRNMLAASAAGLGLGPSRVLAKPNTRYTALALQTLCDAVNQDADKDAARARMSRSIKRIEKQIAVAAAFFQGYSGYPLRLVVLPEYVLTGFPLGESRAQWRNKAAIAKDGATIEKLAGVAQRRGIYLCTNHYERDPAFPELYFQANVVFSPSGDIVLRYRRMISLYAPTPYDVWDAYLDAYGLDAVFPVAKTDVGVLGTIASEEILYPEIARMHALKGAELLLHPTAEVASPQLTVKDVAKRARAIENMAYVISANTGGMAGTPVPQASTDAMSKIVDWYGHVLSEAGYGESMNAVATIDLEGLRSARSNIGMGNMLSRLPMDAFEKSVEDAAHYGPNRLKDGKMQGRKEALNAQRGVIDRLTEQGVFQAPR